MNYGDHNFIEITQQSCESSQLSSTLLSESIDSLDKVERVELCCSTMSTQPKCMGSTRRTCRDESCQVEPSGIWAIELLQLLTEYVAWPCDLDLTSWPLESCHVMPLGWSTPVPSLRCTYTTYRSRVMTITIFHWPPAKSPNFHVLEVKGVKFQVSSFQPPKGTPLAGTTHNDVLIVGMCPKMRSVGVTKKGKKDTNFHASNWLFALTTHVDVSPWNYTFWVVSVK